MKLLLSMRHLRSIPALAVLAVAALLLTPIPTSAQDLHPSRRPSPMGMARTMMGDTYIHVVYSRPYQRGRDNIFGTEESGALVPFGKVWRTGANEATEIALDGDVKVMSHELPAGIYSLFTTPGEKEWQIHFNRALGLNGTTARNPETGRFEEAYDPAKNIVDVTVPVGSIPESDKVDQFTISFDTPEDGAGTTMVLRWINTEIRVPIEPAM